MEGCKIIGGVNHMTYVYAPANGSPVMLETVVEFSLCWMKEPIGPVQQNRDTDLLKCQVFQPFTEVLAQAYILKCTEGQRGYKTSHLVAMPYTMHYNPRCVL